MKRLGLFLVGLLLTVSLAAQQREYIWPKGKMPHASKRQIAAMTTESGAPGFNPDKFRRPYLDWYEAPEHPNGTCMILISGGSYQNCCDGKLIEKWRKELTARGVQCVNFVYRTPRPEGIPYYQTAWEDGQRAVRKVRAQAARRGFDPEKIGVMGMSAGSHLSLQLAGHSLTRAYRPVDALDSISCQLNVAVVNAPAYLTSDADSLGIPAACGGYGPGITLSKVFHFDAQTCPVSLHHGGADKYSPNGSTLVYRELQRLGVPAELHLFPGKGHGAFGFERALEFLETQGFLQATEPAAAPQVAAELVRESIWPEGMAPEATIEWSVPAQRKSDAIQILCADGQMEQARPYLNAQGFTVVTLHYRADAAWQDLQRAIRVVRSEAAEKGLNPDKIGVMGASAGARLALLAVTSARHQAYLPVDAVDKLSCKVQWGISLNAMGVYENEAAPAPEFSFDLDTAPMLLMHSASDPCGAIQSVRVWEKMRAMGVQCELHALVAENDSWLARAGEYLNTL